MKQSATKEKPKNEISVPDTQEIDQKAVSAVQFAQELAIDSNELYGIGAEYLLALRAIEREIEATFDVPIRAAHEAHKAILAAKAKHFEPLKTAEKIIKEKMGIYQLTEEKRQREEDEKLKVLALREEEEEKTRQAEALLAQGKAEEALILLESDQEVSTVLLPPSGLPKAKGIQTREVWKAEVVDFDVLVKAVSKGEASIGLLAPNTETIGKMVKALGKEFKVPGIRVYTEKVIAVTGR